MVVRPVFAATQESPLLVDLKTPAPVAAKTVLSVAKFSDTATERIFKLVKPVFT